MPDSVILGLTTSTEHGGLALVLAGPEPRTDGQPAGQVLIETSYATIQHAEQLMPNLEGLLERGGCTRRDLMGIACDMGPGSFTGVRVGVACAKGIALALGLPLVGVTSLQAMAHRAFLSGDLPAGDVALAMLDAKRGEVFAAAYDAAGNELLAPLHVPVADASSLLARVPGQVIPIGAVARALALPGAAAVSRHSDFPDAGSIAFLGAARIERAAQDPTLAAALDPAVVEPLYVRAPDAKPAGVVL